MVSLATMARFGTAVACSLALTACGSSITLPVASPTPSAVGADSAAADLRTHLDLLFGEHVFVVAKLSVAAAAGRKDEFHSYAGLLAVNGADLTTLMRSALGETQGGQFGQVWMAGNNSYVDYLVAGVTQDQAKADAAKANLADTYVPQMSQLLSASLSLSPQQATQVGADQVSSFEQIIDDAVAAGFTALYPDLRRAYVKAIRAGDLVADAILSRFADKFPGDGRTKSADFRAILDTLLLEQAYLMTMASDATIAGTPTEQAAAGDATATNNTALASTLGGVLGNDARVQARQMWDQEAVLFIAYAKNGDSADRQNAIDTAAGLSNELQEILQAVDDQRAKSFDKLAGDDRAAALMLAAAGDAITASAVKAVPAKFI